MTFVRSCSTSERLLRKVAAAATLHRHQAALRRVGEAHHVRASQSRIAAISPRMPISEIIRLML